MSSRGKRKGFGIKDISLFNNALLAKWKWRMMSGHGGLWYHVIKSKYGGWQNLVRSDRDIKIWKRNFILLVNAVRDRTIIW